MTAKLIKGTEIREEILSEIKAEVAEIKEKHGVVPGLVTILVGENPASISYVTLKIKTANELGFKEIQDSQPVDISEDDLLALVEKYNRDDSIHGILVQLPLPKHLDEKKVLNAIDPDKDVDGFHPVNVGRLRIGGSEVKFPPCTPAGIQEMIVRSGVQTEGAEVVVVGRSNIVGKPIANMMLQKGDGANSTVTIVHTRTKDLAAHCKRADILIVAAGVPGLVKPEWIRPGACVIDVGVNRVGEKISEKTGKKVAILKGDVDFDAAKEIAGYITPVPGGVGPMTVTMLMKNTLKSLKFKLGIAESKRLSALLKKNLMFFIKLPIQLKDLD
ncbi:MAG: bifunctional methylenetetrahydrofolate dehydrogenase/methenyltetrahydrofolate cyclohydrolase FolD [Desulfobacterales bacterium]|nr:MAG: bifunctional methylenetetrahydrofolate dehydrogenase/methenyltetrahydrofolate cyclohydrolase FolD [Desulfobacterales bacterium]